MLGSLQKFSALEVLDVSASALMGWAEDEFSGKHIELVDIGFEEEFRQSRGGCGFETEYLEELSHFEIVFFDGVMGLATWV